MKKRLLALFVIFCIKGVDLAKSPKGYNVGCVKCHPLDDNKINVHLIPHSHDDVGWTSTVDQYFYGNPTENSFTKVPSVEQIITSVVEALTAYPDRRYIQVETAYFYKWWQGNHQQRENFKHLVRKGQIEMVNGAWSMNDEACVNYQSTIDQFTWGLRTIEDTLGECGRPRVGWQIDPFGHSREQASLLSQMGYDALLFARLDHDDKENRIEKGELEFLWKGSANIDDSVIFAGCFPNRLYNEPDNFCWDVLCSDDVIIDNPDSPLYDLPEKVEAFEAILKNFTNYYPKTVRNIIVPMGGDFQFQTADKQFLNMERLIKGFENNTEFNLIFSTPSCYIKAVNDAKPNLTLKTDDFFPYSDEDHAFWAGYFTSRPTIKRFERTGHTILQATKQMYALSSNRSFDDKLEKLRKTMGVLQHHDAITGTETEEVAKDYVRMLTAAIKEAEEPTGQIISDILESNIGLSLSTCLLSNMSICSTSQNNENFIIVAYNPLAWKTNHYIRLPVELGKYEVFGPDGSETFDIVETLFSFDYVNITNEKPAKYELVFAAKSIPPMGFKIYHIRKVTKEESNLENNSTIDNEFSIFKIDNETNLLSSVILNGVSLNISQNFYYYQSADGFHNMDSASGAYIFRPDSEKSYVLPNVTSRRFFGNLVEELYQKWNCTYADVYQIIRWYKGENYLEFDWIVGNINGNVPADGVGKEIISRFTIEDFDNKDVFYTDSNGREMIKRTKNQRPTYTYNSSQEPIASNYYPVTSRIVLKDEEKNLEVAVLTDRSQGGSSLEKGELELMVHRRLIYDDNRGVGEALDEYEFATGLYARGSHYLVFGPSNKTDKNNLTTTSQQRILAQKKLLQPWIGLSPTNLTFKELSESIELSYSALNKEMPENINILTLEPWLKNRYLLRLEHILEKDEDFVLSKPVTISDIKNLFKKIKVTEVTETVLAAHLTLDELKNRGKYNWNTANGSEISYPLRKIESVGEVTLNPMEIRTFILKIEQNPNSGTVKCFNLIFSSILFLVVYLF